MLFVFFCFYSHQNELFVSVFSSLAIHPNNILIATGQCAGHDKRSAVPHIRIWDSTTLDTRTIIESNFIGAICCLSFSKADEGSLLTAVDESNDHVISIWKWEQPEKITETRVRPLNLRSRLLRTVDYILVFH